MTSSDGGPAPVLASWRVSEVLDRYPQLLDVFLAASPAFRHLRNPLVRRVQTRLVTVAQAARVAGLEPPDLTHRLNAALGLWDAPEPGATDGPAARPAADPSAFDSAPVAEEVDARPYHERGEEPFSAIMAALGRVPAGQVLRLRNTFEPLPLYDVAARRGFAHRARQLGPSDWEVLLLKVGVGVPPPAANGTPAAAPAADADADAWPSPTEVVRIDVSDLVPPEPMVRILEAAERLQPGQALLVEHVRRPVYLYPRLDALGYVHATRELGPGRIEILIRRPLETDGGPVDESSAGSEASAARPTG